MLKKIMESEAGRGLSNMMSRLDQKAQALRAADFAEHALRFFEIERPDDDRPRKAVDGARAWARGEIRVGEARRLALASHAAAREAKGEPAIAAARAAGHAVATAHVARHSNGAWLYAAKAAFHAGGQKAMEREMRWQGRRLAKAAPLGKGGAPKQGPVDAYIAGFPADIGERLGRMRAAIREAAPDAEETIRYRMPTYRLNGKNLVHFAGYAGHVGFYPTPSAIERFAKELAKYKTSKGAVQFPHGGPLPLGLVKRMVVFRVGECGGKIRT